MKDYQVGDIWLRCIGDLRLSETEIFEIREKSVKHGSRAAEYSEWEERDIFEQSLFEKLGHAVYRRNWRGIMRRKVEWLR